MKLVHGATSHCLWGRSIQETKEESTMGRLAYRAMILQSCWHGSLPFFDGIGALMAKLYNCIPIHNPSYSRQFFHGANAGLQIKELHDGWLFGSNLLDYNHCYAGVVLQCIYSTANLKFHSEQMKAVLDRMRVRNSHENLLRRITERNEQCLTYILVVVTLQLLLHLTRVNVTTLFLPMLFQTTGCRSKAAQISNLVLVAVNSGGIFASAFTTKHYGRVVLFMISGVLIIFCQIAIPLIMEVHIGLGGSARMSTGYTIAMFVLACVVSGGFSWSWGALFWAVPGKRLQSVGQAMGMAFNFGLGFVQMQCFLLMLRRLKHPTFAHYAMWIWS